MKSLPPNQILWSTKSPLSLQLCKSRSKSTMQLPRQWLGPVTWSQPSLSSPNLFHQDPLPQAVFKWGHRAKRSHHIAVPSSCCPEETNKTTICLGMDRVPDYAQQQGLSTPGQFPEPQSPPSSNVWPETLDQGAAPCPSHGLPLHYTLDRPT